MLKHLLTPIRIYSKRMSDKFVSTSTWTWKELKFEVPWGHIAAKSWGDPASKLKVMCIHDSQKIKKKTKIPRATDEGWNTQKQLPVPVEKRRSRRRKLLYPHPKLSLGWLDNAGSFDHLIPLLPNKDLHIIAIDLPGHGLSSHRPPGFNQVFVDYVVDVRRVVNILDWKHFTFMCHSMGANIAGVYSVLFPENVDNLLLIEGILPLYNYIKQGDMISKLKTAVEEAAQTEDKPNRIYTTKEEAIQRIMQGNFELTRDAAITLAKRGVKQNKTGGFEFARDIRLKKNSLMKFSYSDLIDIASKFTKNILVVVALGGSLKESVLEIIKSVQQVTDKVHHCEVPGNHHVHLNEPLNVRDIVADFLFQQDGKL